MSGPNPSRPYASTAKPYHKGGWHPIPLPWGKKWPPPTGVTGHAGHPPTIETIRMWCTRPAFKDAAEGNVGLVMSDDVIGIDVDHYGPKTGGDTLATLEAKLRTPLPPTIMSTARDDGISGIRFFRVPAGRKWKEGYKDIEIIQRTHRYAVVYPSIHEKLGTPYRWIDQRTTVPLSADYLPYPTDLEWLADKWIEELTEEEVYTKPSERVTFTEQDADGILTGGDPCKTVRAQLDKYAERKANDSARFIAMRNTQMALVGHGEQGHQGVHAAILALRKVYLADIADEKRDGPGKFQRALNGAIGKH